MNNIYALLIGVDFYFPDPLPGGIYYPSLGGCVRDISHVHAYLTDVLHMPADHILKLSATNKGGGQPAEAQELWPTYENMVAKFRQVTAMAQPGDQLYIHYSGHGGRAKTIFGDLKGDGLDEALVPTDIGKQGGRYLRDVELGRLLKEMVDKQLVVTVVLDSCHSGGATRGRGAAVKRGISAVDMRELPAESLVAPVDELMATWQQSGGTTRAAKPASGWLLEPKGYVLFAACRASESAYEFPFDGKESNGALTYWLLDSLRQAGPGYSYKMLYDRIQAKVHAKFAEQTPQLQGESDRALFGSESIQPHFAVSVLKLNNAGDHVQLAAGEVQGLREGAQFAIYPNRPGVDFDREEQRLALVEVSRLDEVTAWAKVMQEYGRGVIEQGAQAILLYADDVYLQCAVAVVVEDAALRKEVETAIAEDGKGFVKVAEEAKEIDYQVARNDNGEFEVWDPTGAVVQNLRPPLRPTEAGSVATLVKRLIHLSKYHNVQALNMPDPSTRQKLKVELLGGQESSEAEEPVSYRPGDQIKLRITNTQTPGAANDPTRILNVCVLSLDSDWSVTQIYPANAAFEPLDPGQSIEPQFEAYLPDEQQESASTFKIFATQATTEFRWLQLPALDQPSQPRSAQRSALSDPLTMLLASVTDETANTRAFKLVSSPQEDRGWTVEQLDLVVQAQVVGEV